MHNNRPSAQSRRPARIALALVLATVLGACAGAAAPSPSPSPVPTGKPTPTPIVAPVGTPAAAAALVIATNPMFAGAMPLAPDVIGASKFWVATPTAGGGYTIEMTIGWGDCPAGCINKHVWTFDVAANGTVKLVSEAGDEVPTDLPA